MSGIARMFGRPAAIVAAALALSAASSCAPDEPVVQAISAQDGPGPADPAPGPAVPCVVPTPTEPPPRTHSDYTRAERQQIVNHELIDEAIAPVYDVTETAAGFAKTVVDGSELTAEISWKGEPPARITELAGTTPSCVRVSIVRVPYSAADVRAAVRRLGHAGTDGRIPRFDRASATDAYDGLDIGFVRATLDSIDVDRTRAAYAEIARMPIRITETERIHPTA